MKKQKEKADNPTTSGRASAKAGKLRQCSAFSYSPPIILLLHSEDSLFHMHRAGWETAMINTEETVSCSCLAHREAKEECWFPLDNQREQ